jgi:hypothetical protein
VRSIEVVEDDGRFEDVGVGGFVKDGVWEVWRWGRRSIGWARTRSASADLRVAAKRGDRVAA